MENQTIRQIADNVDRTERTVQRWIDKYNSEFNTDHPNGLNDTISDGDLLHYIEEKSGVIAPKKTESKTQKVNHIPDIKIQPGDLVFRTIDNGFSNAPDKEFTKEEHEAFGKEYLKRTEGLFNEIDKKEEQKYSVGNFLEKDLLAIVSMLILVSADAFSCGWIAYEAFDKFIPAVVFFSLIGVAVAYAAIKNAMSFTGYNADAWLWGFGVFQLLLHASALKMFESSTYEDASIAVGKAVICICIPLASSGIAVIFKSKK